MFWHWSIMLQYTPVIAPKRPVFQLPILDHFRQVALVMYILLNPKNCSGTNTSMWLDGYLFAPIAVHNQPKLADNSHMWAPSVGYIHLSRLVHGQSYPYPTQCRLHTSIQTSSQLVLALPDTVQATYIYLDQFTASPSPTRHDSACLRIQIQATRTPGRSNGLVHGQLHKLRRSFT